MGTLGTTDTETLKEQLKGIVDAGSAKIDDAKTKILDGKDVVRDRAYAAYDKTTDAIKAHPLKAVAIAFGVGYIAMRLFR